MQTEQAIERVRVGARIRELRKAHALTARQLADSIGCSDTHIFNIEAGRSRATYDTRLAIAAVLGVSVADLDVAS